MFCLTLIARYRKYPCQKLLRCNPGTRGARMLEHGQSPKNTTSSEGRLRDQAQLTRATMLIVSDMRLLRDGLSALLLPDFSSGILRAADPVAAVGVAEDLRPDLILLDAEVLNKHGLARRIREAAPMAKFIVFALGAIDENILSSADIGISGFVGRSGSARDLILAIEQSRLGQFSANHEVTTVLIEGLVNAYRVKATMPRSGPLTRRQRQIVPLLEQGLSNKQIARFLGIELPTVKNHVHSILERMQLSRRGQVVGCSDASIPGQLPGQPTEAR